MVQRYWSKMTQMKFHLIYLGYHYHRYINIERSINIFLAVVSTGSLAGFCMSSYKMIPAIILVVSQMLTAAKPYLPYSNRIRELDKGISSWNMIYEEVEEQWYDVSTGVFDESKINELLYKYEKKWNKTDSEVIREDSLPRIAKYIDNADKDKNRYFEVMFGGVHE